jgi:hypothetical protein
VSESADEQMEEPPGDVDDPGIEEGAQAALDEMLETIRQAKVGPLILSTVSTFASVAYGKLEMKDLTQAKTAIDVIDALVPLLGEDVDEDIRRDFTQALTNLKLAYADAVAAAE